jgi:hypothetical protein
VRVRHSLDAGRAFAAFAEPWGVVARLPWRGATPHGQALRTRTSGEGYFVTHDRQEEYVPIVEWCVQVESRTHVLIGSVCFSQCRKALCRRQGSRSYHLESSATAWVPLVKGVKGFKGRFEYGHLKSIPDWYIEKLSR